MFLSCCKYIRFNTSISFIWIFIVTLECSDSAVPLKSLWLSKERRQDKWICTRLYFDFIVHFTEYAKSCKWWERNNKNCNMFCNRKYRVILNVLGKRYDTNTWDPRLPKNVWFCTDGNVKLFPGFSQSCTLIVMESAKLYKSLFGKKTFSTL